MTEKENNGNNESYGCLLLAAVLTGVFNLIWPGWLPFGFFQLWNLHGTSVDQWLWAGCPVFLWAFVVTTLTSVFTRTDLHERRNAEKIFAEGAKVSFLAGVFEEIFYRWFFFLGAILLVKFLNFLFFGFLGFGILENLHLYVLGPLANFFTLGYLKDYIANPSVWYVGAGVLSANAFFRDGHKYLGAIGYVNSWFLGMYFFYITFNYGLLAAIIVHFLYDLIIFTVQYLDSVYERKFC